MTFVGAMQIKKAALGKGSGSYQLTSGLTEILGLMGNTRTLIHPSAITYSSIVIII